jgi:hypothetical protein
MSSDLLEQIIEERNALRDEVTRMGHELRAKVQCQSIAPETRSALLATQQKEKLINQLLGSRSWRYTRPLRKLRRLLDSLFKL